MRFSPIEGVGDEARINLDSGELTVRVQNLTFVVTACKGTPEPQTRKSLDVVEFAKASASSTE